MKILIVGAGMIGRIHTRTVRKFGHVPVLCDSLRQNVDDVGEEFSVAHRYTNYNEAIEQAGAQAVIVCTPNHLHAPIAICAMEHGCDVLCEKPMAATSVQAREMLEVSRRTGRRLMVGYTLRAGNAIKRTMEILAGGSLGRVLSARCVLGAPETLDEARTPYRLKYETGGGVIYDYTHELDYTRLLIGDPKECFCWVNTLLRADQSADDTADMLLRYDNGTVLHIHMDYLQERGRGKGRCYELVCEKGFLACDFRTLMIANNDGTDLCEDVSITRDESFETQLGRFIRWSEEDLHLCAMAEDGLRVMEIADALYASARTGQQVKMYP